MKLSVNVFVFPGSRQRWRLPPPCVSPVAAEVHLIRHLSEEKTNLLSPVAVYEVVSEVDVDLLLSDIWSLPVRPVTMTKKKRTFS